MTATGPSYVATADLLRFLGTRPDRLDERVDVLTSQPNAGLRLVSTAAAMKRDLPPPTTAPLPDPQYTSLPGHPAHAGAAGTQRLDTDPGRLARPGRPLTAQQLTDARDLAVNAGLTVESRDPQDELLVLRHTMTAGGAVLALAILAMTIGLIRAEAAQELRTLTAAGARPDSAHPHRDHGRLRRPCPRRRRRCRGSRRAGPGRRQPDRRARVPVAQLVFIAAGVPLIAATPGWILTARKPRSLARIRLE